MLILCEFNHKAPPRQTLVNKQKLTAFYILFPFFMTNNEFSLVRLLLLRIAGLQ